MPIALDTSSMYSPGTGATASSLTWSHTCTGDNLALFVACGIPTTDTITGVTYNGVAMTQIGKAFVPGNRYIYLYGLLHPSTGANNIVVSASASVLLRGMAASYTGVRGISPFPDSSNTGTDSSVAGFTLATTTVLDNSWLVMAGRATTTTITAGANTTIRQQTGDGDWLSDSNAAQTPAGSHSQTVSFAAGQDVAGVIASFAPIVTTTNYLANYRASSGGRLSFE